MVALVAAWTGRHGSTVNPVSGRLDVDVGCCRGFGPCLLVSPRGGGGRGGKRGDRGWRLNRKLQALMKLLGLVALVILKGLMCPASSTKWQLVDTG